MSSTSSPKTLSSMSNVFADNNNRKIALIIGGVLVVAVLAYLGRSLVFAGFVNKEPISRLAVIQELEAKGGKQVIDGIIAKKLVLQEAKKKNIVISQKEIDAEYKKIEKQYTDLGQNFGELLKSKGITKAKFDEEIRVQLSIEKLIGKDVVVSDKELEDAVTANKERIAAEKDQEAAKAVLKEQIRQDKLQAKYQTWITELRNKAKVQLLVNY